jgi:general secretion pathway protein D
MEVRTTRRYGLLVAFIAALLAPITAVAQRDSSVVQRGDSITVRLVDVDLRAAVQVLGQYLDRPVIFSGTPAASRVTLETPQPVARADVIRLLRGLLESQNLEMVSDSAAGLYRVRQKELPRTPAAQDLARAERTLGATELFTIRLRHARAADVAATVNALYGRGGALGELGDRRQTLDQGLRENVVTPQQLPEQPLPEAAAGARGRAANLAGEVTIVPDARSNSLLIRASREDFQLIEAAVKELDVRPLQALIEVLIAEVRRDRNFSFGVETRVPQTHVPGSDNTTIGGSTTGGGLGDFVIKVMGAGGIDVEATLRAGASRGDVRILSRPVVIAANNEDAQILVGSQRPFIQVARSLPTDAPSRDQVVQYKDVGTRLIVRPTISQDGYIMLEVTQEVNAATNEVQFDAPVISTRTVETQLLVKDGQTVVLGGLSDRQRERNQGGVPVLSSIPLLGGLFGRASRRTTETELFLFITPRVIRTDADADAVTEPLRKKAEEAKP